MFVRFVCNQSHPILDAELGMFSARDAIDFSQHPRGLQRAHDEAFYWFKADGGGGLAMPRLKGKARTREVRKSLFWFKKEGMFYRREAGSVIHRARNLAAVLSAAGCEVREIEIDDPGTIIWQDSLQVLALPYPEAILRAF